MNDLVYNRLMCQTNEQSQNTHISINVAYYIKFSVHNNYLAPYRIWLKYKK